MFHNNVEVAVLVKGRPVTEYPFRGQIFIEGRSGSNYEIEIRNKNAFRIEAVVSVDGLSVTDGKAAGAQSGGYVIDAHRSVRIPGWTLDNASTAHFAFTGKERSYGTEASGGDSRNNGVIGIMVFKEKYVPSRYEALSPFPIATYYSGNPNIGAMSSSLAGSLHNANSLNEARTKGAWGSRGIAGGPISPSYGEVKTSGGLWSSTSGQHDGVVCSSNTMSYNAVPQASAYNSPRVSETIIDQSTYGFEQPVVQTLGTAFGERTEYATTKVNFPRGDMLSMMVLYYDEARGLKARGIQMVRPSKQKYQTAPDAFPAMVEGCKPPRGWRG